MANKENDPNFMNSSKNQVTTSRKLAVINSVSGIATHIISLTVLVWLQKYLLDHVSIEEYSLFPVVAAPMVFVPLITTILTAGLGRYSVDAYAKGNEKRVTEIVSTMTPLLMIAGLVVAAFGALGIWQIDSILKIEEQFVDDARWMMTILVSAAVLRVSFAAFGVGLFIKQKFVFVNMIDLGCQVLRISLLALLLIAIDTRVVWVVLATTLANTTGFFIKLFMSRRLVPAIRFKRSHIRKEIAPEIVSFGSWTFLQQASTASRLFLSIFLLNRFAGSIHVTAFHLGTLVLKQVQTLTLAALKPLAPPLVAMWAHGERDRIRAVYLNGGRYALWLATFATCPAIIFGPKAVALYLGKTEADIELTTRVMVIAMLILPIRFGNIMMGRIANTAGMAKQTCGVVMTIHLGVIAIMSVLVIGYDMGALGAAISILAANVLVIPTIALPFAFRITGLTARRWLRETVLPGVLPGLIASFFWLALSIYFAPTTWAGLMSCGIPGSLIFVVIVFRFSLKRREREDLLKAAGKIKSKLLPT